MKKLILLLSLSIIITLNTCTENPINGDDNIPPGRRDYIWTVDTLNIPFTTLQRIWGSSPQDVWAIGPGGDADKTIYHFDGVKWSSDGISRPLSPTAIFGFSIENVWIGGRGGDIWNYNGSNWVKNTTITIQDYGFVGFEDIWGNSPNNVYAVGYAYNGEKSKGIIVKFDGNKWYSIEIPEIRNSFIKIRRGEKTSNDYFISGVRFEQFAEDTSFIYKFNGAKLSEIYRGLMISSEIAGLESINEEMYFLQGDKIYKYVNNNFELFLQIGEPAAIWGRNKKDLLLGKSNGIAHYNGTDIQYLYQFDDLGIRIFTAVIFEKEIFVLAYDVNNSLNLIIRGKLK